jgi:hypothetical protein
MVVLRIIDPYSHLNLGVISKVDHLDQSYVLLYTLHLAKILFYFFPYFFLRGLLDGRISSIPTLMLTVFFVDGSS